MVKTMTYCRKCGSELRDDARSCPGCGVSVTVTDSEPQRRSMDKHGVSREVAKIVIVVIVGILVVAIVLGALPTLFQSGRQIGETINPTNVIITSQNLRTGNSGLDYVAWVDVSFHNDGGPGTVVVWVQVTQGSNSWKKSQSTQLDSQGSRDLTLYFPEVGLWTTQSISYRVWIE